MFGWFITVFMVGFVLGVVFERKMRPVPKRVVADLAPAEIEWIEREFGKNIIIRETYIGTGTYELIHDPSRPGTSNDDVDLAIARARTQSMLTQFSK